MIWGFERFERNGCYEKFAPVHQDASASVPRLATRLNNATSRFLQICNTCNEKTPSEVWYFTFTHSMIFGVEVQTSKKWQAKAAKPSQHYKTRSLFFKFIENDNETNNIKKRNNWNCADIEIERLFCSQLLRFHWPLLKVFAATLQPWLQSWQSENCKRLLGPFGHVSPFFEFFQHDVMWLDFGFGSVQLNYGYFSLTDVAFEVSVQPAREHRGKHLSL